MNTNIVIRIRKRIAELMTDSHIVNGNSDFTVTFDFDAEWNEYPDKTARFAYCDGCGVRHWIDVPFTGDTCVVPVLRKIFEVDIGVYAGNIRTTSPARVRCEMCITDIPSVPHVPKRDVFNEISEKVNEVLRNRR